MENTLTVADLFCCHLTLFCSSINLCTCVQKFRFIGRLLCLQKFRFISDCSCVQKFRFIIINSDLTFQPLVSVEIF